MSAATHGKARHRLAWPLVALGLALSLPAAAAAEPEEQEPAKLSQPPKQLQPSPPPQPPQPQQRAPIRDHERIFRKYVYSYKELQQRQIVMQQLDYSCGAAALATVIRYYWGDNVDESLFLGLLPKLKLSESQLKDRIENGLTLTDLRDLANKAGYEAVMGRVEFKELAEALVPVVVGITIKKHDHFAVYRGTDGTFVYLADPIRGNIRMPVPKFLEQWQKNAILVIAKPNTKVKDVNPMAVRQSEVDRGWLNDQYVRRNVLTIPVPNPVRVGP